LLVTVRSKNLKFMHDISIQCEISFFVRPLPLFKFDSQFETPNLRLLRFIPFTASVEDAIRILKESKVSVLPISYRVGVDSSTVSFPDLVKLLVKVNFEKEVFLRANVCVALSYDQMLIVQPHAMLEDCILLMENKHLYEVGLLKPSSSEIEHFISQSDIVRFIYNNREALLWD
jgi:CBS-domain-containing membrane protein